MNALLDKIREFGGNAEGLAAWIEKHYEPRSRGFTIEQYVAGANDGSLERALGQQVPGSIQFGELTLPSDYPAPAPADPQPGQTCPFHDLPLDEDGFCPLGRPS